MQKTTQPCRALWKKTPAWLMTGNVLISCKSWHKPSHILALRYQTYITATNSHINNRLVKWERPPETHYANALTIKLTELTIKLTEYNKVAHSYRNINSPPGLSRKALNKPVIAGERLTSQQTHYLCRFENFIDVCLYIALRMTSQNIPNTRSLTIIRGHSLSTYATEECRVGSNAKRTPMYCCHSDVINCAYRVSGWVWCLGIRAYMLNEWSLKDQEIGWKRTFVQQRRQLLYVACADINCNAPWRGLVILERAKAIGWKNRTLTSTNSQPQEACSTPK